MYVGDYIMENLYETEREYLMDIQLSVTECDLCGADLNPMESTPVNVEGIKKFYYPNTKNYIFICRGCK